MPENPDIRRAPSLNPGTAVIVGAGPGGLDVQSIREVVKHGLTQEMQILYGRIVSAVRSAPSPEAAQQQFAQHVAQVQPNRVAEEERAARRAVFLSVERDGGLQQLIPYLSLFVQKESK